MPVVLSRNITGENIQFLFQFILHHQKSLKNSSVDSYQLSIQMIIKIYFDYFHWYIRIYMWLKSRTVSHYPPVKAYRILNINLNTDIKRFRIRVEFYWHTYEWCNSHRRVKHTIYLDCCEVSHCNSESMSLNVTCTNLLHSEKILQVILIENCFLKSKLWIWKYISNSFFLGTILYLTTLGINIHLNAGLLTLWKWINLNSYHKESWVVYDQTLALDSNLIPETYIPARCAFNLSGSIILNQIEKWENENFFN